MQLSFPVHQCPPNSLFLFWSSYLYSECPPPDPLHKWVQWHRGEIPCAPNPICAKQHNSQKLLETATENLPKSYSIKEGERKIANTVWKKSLKKWKIIITFREKLLQSILYLWGKFPFVDNRAAATSQYPECHSLPPDLKHCFPLPFPSDLVVTLQPLVCAQVMPRAVGAMGYRAGRQPGCDWQESRDSTGRRKRGVQAAGLKRVSPLTPPGKVMSTCLSVPLQHWQEAELSAQHWPPEIEWESWVIFPDDHFVRGGLAGYDNSHKLFWRKMK